jgi:transposase
MSRLKKDPLRPLRAEERSHLERVSRALGLPAALVARAKVLLAVANGSSYTAAAQLAGRRTGDAVTALVSRFNRQGLTALEPRHSGGPAVVYDAAAKERILTEFRRPPDRKLDGTVTWSLTTLQRALRRAPEGLPGISTYTIWLVLHEAGLSWQRDRSWCKTGAAIRRRKRGGVVVEVEVHDADAVAKKALIEQAYTEAPRLGLAVWGMDEAGPYQAIPQPGICWQPLLCPVRYPHEYVRHGTAKMLTLFHPSTGTVRVKGVRNCPNAVLHVWLKQQLLIILAGLPPAPVLSEADNRVNWERWQAGLTSKPTLSADLPPLRLLLIMDNLAGHKTRAFVEWLIAHGVLPLYTPLSGSWLNMTESVQRILIHRALDGTAPTSPEDIITWLEETAGGWNADPTPFVWGGPRHARRQRAYQRRHPLGGSGACTTRPIRRRPVALTYSRHPCQVTH